MESLSQNDLASLLEFLRANYMARDLPEFRQYVITALPQVVRSEVTGYNEVDLQKWRDEHILYPAERMDFPNSYELFNKHIRDHPVINHLAATQKPAILRISDFVTHRQFRRTGLYQEFFRRVGTRDQISVTLKLAKRAVVGLALNHSRDYRERDRLLLTLLRPHLVQAYENSVCVSRLKEELEAARHSLEEVNVATILVRSDDQASDIAPFAQKLLKKHFHSWTRYRRLPETIRDWMRAENVRLKRFSSPQPLVIQTHRKSLEIRMLFQSGGTLLLLREKEEGKPLEINPKSFAVVGLSSREADVLRWVAKGRTNHEIGQILNLSARTVQKHLEHIFQKLGVESRTAAAARAWEWSSKSKF